MPLRAVLFDLDGTLVDSLGDIATAMNHALVAHGLPPHPEAAYLRFVGEGVAMLAERATRGAIPELQGRVLATYHAYYDTHLFDRTVAYPGVADALLALARDGLRLGVLSNKSDDFVKRLVARFLPGVPFTGVYGERPGIPRKPDPTAALALAGSWAWLRRIAASWGTPPWTWTPRGPRACTAWALPGASARRRSCTRTGRGRSSPRRTRWSPRCGPRSLEEQQVKSGR